MKAFAINIQMKYSGGRAPKRPWDPLRFFRWRNYQDYGTGVAGDLYVHMLSMLHFLTRSKGPERVMATGGLRCWKDGRDVPDIHIGLFDNPASAEHPAFNLTLRTNLVSGGGDKYLFRTVGSEGDSSIGWDNLVVRRTPFPKAPSTSQHNDMESAEWQAMVAKVSLPQWIMPRSEEERLTCKITVDR